MSNFLIDTYMAPSSNIDVCKCQFVERNHNTTYLVYCATLDENMLTCFFALRRKRDLQGATSFTGPIRTHQAQQVHIILNVRKTIKHSYKTTFPLSIVFCPCSLSHFILKIFFTSHYVDPAFRYFAKATESRATCWQASATFQSLMPKFDHWECYE